MKRIEFLDKIDTGTKILYRYKKYFSGKFEIIETKSPIHGIEADRKNETN